VTDVGQEVEQHQQSNVVEKANKVQRDKDKLKKIARRALRVGRILANPKSWIAFAIVLAVVAVVAWGRGIVEVFGSNENIDGCEFGDGNYPSGVDVHNANDAKKNRDIVGAWLMSHPFAWLGNKPMTKAQAAAFLGNAWAESEYDPGRIQGQESYAKSSKMSNDELLAMGHTGSKAAGFWQWDVEGREGLAKMAKQKGKDWQDLSLQLEYFASTFTPQNYDKVNYAKRMLSHGFNDPNKTVEELTKIVCRDWEVAGIENMSKRNKGAKDFMAEFQGSPQMTGGSCTMDDTNSQLAPGQLTTPIVKGKYTIGNHYGESGAHWRKTHTGQDFVAPIGTPVVAVSNAEVVSVGEGARWAGRHGIKLKLPDGSMVFYAHLSASSVVPGQKVTRGQVIGNVGAEGNVTGPHLHFEYLPRGGHPGSTNDTVDPMKWMQSNGVSA